MSTVVDCPGCQHGDHDRHVGPWNVRKGVLGGSVCGCRGDCAERAAKTREEFRRRFQPARDDAAISAEENALYRQWMAELSQAERERDEARAEVQRLRAQMAEARQWIVNSVDGAKVGFNRKQRMLDALADN